MKKYIVAVLLCLSSALVFGQVLPCVYHAPGKELRFFEDRVRIRTSPNLSAAVLGFGKINEALTILERDPAELELDNVRAHWYKVRWNGNVGYVWGGLIANVFYDGDFNGDGKIETLLVRPKYIQLCNDTYGIEMWAEYMEKYTADFRLAKGYLLISEKPFGEWDYSKININNINIIDLGADLGLKLIEVGWGFGDGHYSLCFSTTIFFLKEKMFSVLFEREDIFRGGVSEYGSYYQKSISILTKSQHGRNNVLIIECWEITETKEKKTNALLWRKIFFWNGKEFIELQK